MSGTGAPLYSLMAVSSLSSLATGYSQSKAIKARGAYEEGVANTNAAMAELAGEETLSAGDVSASRKNLETKQKVAQVKAEQGASGVDVSSGSSAAVRAGLNLVGATDEMTIRDNARRTAFGYKTQAVNDRFQGKFARMTAKSEANQSLLSGGLQAVERPLSIYSYYNGQGYVNKTKKVPSSYINQDYQDFG